MQEALDEYLKRIADAMVNQLFENKSVASGNLARSIKNNNEVVETNNGYEGILTMLWYGEVVDDGTGRGPGGMPPIRPIEDWIKRKRIPVPSNFKSPKQFAFAIAKNIEKQGDRGSKKPYPFINNSIELVKKQFGDKLITKAAGENIEQQLTLAFEKSAR
jgi:hypothetical protein